MASELVLSGDVDRVRKRLRARFGLAVSDHAIDSATVAAFARYRSARVNNFVALLAERDAIRRLTRSLHAPERYDIADIRRARAVADLGLDEPTVLGGAA